MHTVFHLYYDKPGWSELRSRSVWMPGIWRGHFQEFSRGPETQMKCPKITLSLSDKCSRIYHNPDTREKREMNRVRGQTRAAADKHPPAIMYLDNNQPTSRGSNCACSAWSAVNYASVRIYVRTYYKHTNVSVLLMPSDHQTSSNHADSSTSAVFLLRLSLESLSLPLLELRRITRVNPSLNAAKCPKNYFNS